ncbi:hypothetical protein V8C86DRAFT_3026948 [Haematococcus lacustris]
MHARFTSLEPKVRMAVSLTSALMVAMGCPVADVGERKGARAVALEPCAGWSRGVCAACDGVLELLVPGRTCRLSHRLGELVPRGAPRSPTRPSGGARPSAHCAAADGIVSHRGYISGQTT